MNKSVIFSAIVILVILAVGYEKMRENSQTDVGLQAVNQTCMESVSKGEIRFWECFCSKIKYSSSCKEYPDCTWTDLKSNDYLCMEKPCMDYTKEECKRNIRCVWVFDKNSGKEYCEGTESFSPEKHVKLGDSNQN
jgi:hypothetical protein